MLPIFSGGLDHLPYTPFPHTTNQQQKTLKIFMWQKLGNCSMISKVVCSRDVRKRLYVGNGWIMKSLVVAIIAIWGRTWTSRQLKSLVWILSCKHFKKRRSCWFWVIFLLLPQCFQMLNFHVCSHLYEVKGLTHFDMSALDNFW